MIDIKGKWITIGNYRIKARRCLSENRFGLSLREIETLFHLSKGRTAEQIAKRMNVKPNTVNTYKTRLFEKLNVNTSAEACAIATAIVCGAAIEYQDNLALEAA